MRRRIVTVAASLLLAALVGCGGSSSPAASTERRTSGPTTTSPVTATHRVPDACTLITAAQVQAIFGRDPGEPRSVPLGEPPSSWTCTFKMVAASVGLAANFDANRNAFEQEGHSTKALTGVGDAGYWDGEGHFFVARNQTYMVAANFVAPPASGSMLEAGKRLLSTMLENL
jgi:hypothetical protein